MRHNVFLSKGDFTDRNVTLKNYKYKLVNEFYTPNDIFDMVYAYFLYYGVSIDNASVNSRKIVIHFHNKRKRGWLRYKPANSRARDIFFNLSVLFVYIFPVVFLSDIFAGSYNTNKYFLAHFLNRFVRDTLTSLLISFVAMTFFSVLRDKLGKFSRIVGETSVKIKKDLSTIGTINIFKDKHRSKGEFLRVLFHELDHILWRFEGGVFDLTGYYDESPHEIRAQVRAKYWVDRWLSFELDEKNEQTHTPL